MNLHYKIENVRYTKSYFEAQTSTRTQSFNLDRSSLIMISLVAVVILTFAIKIISSLFQKNFPLSHLLSFSSWKKIISCLLQFS